MPRLLLIEDDEPLGRSLHAALRRDGFDSTWVRSAEDGQRFLAAETFDLLLLDIVLPGSSGLDLLRALRLGGESLPVIMLTARDAVSDRVHGLDAGADDYLPKPFAMEELLSRLRSVLRRRGAHGAALWQLGALTIDTAARRVLVGQEPIALTRREYTLLLRLASAPGTVFTRQQLARDGAHDIDDSNAIDVVIHALRKKLGASRISTARGIGYALEVIET